MWYILKHDTGGIYNSLQIIQTYLKFKNSNGEKKQKKKPTLPIFTHLQQQILFVVDMKLI